MEKSRLSWIDISLTRLALALFILGPSSTSLAADADGISLTGTLESAACPAVCGSCCSTTVITDTSGEITLGVGNAFVDLEKVIDDGLTHKISGHYYQTPGQCEINICNKFAVESLDAQLISEPSYDVQTEVLSIQSLVVNDAGENRYRVALSAPFNIDQATNVDDLELVPQGGDCAAADSQCDAGTACLSYPGIAGSSGPTFHTCEIPCSFAGASCPIGQSCTVIADGPGAVCVADEASP